MTTRYPAVANQFYPGDEKILKSSILKYLEKAEPIEAAGKIKGLICPHAGYVYSGWTAAYSYKLLQNLDQNKKWKILLLGPSHYVPFYGAAAPIEDKWEMPFGSVEVADIRKEIKKSENIVEVREANTQEHSLEVQVPFLQTVLKNFVLYPLVLGEVDPKKLANDLSEFAEKDDVIVIASSDLSHFLEYNEAKSVDKKTCDAIKKLDISEMEKIGDACGKTGILTLMNIAKNLGWKCQMLDYRNSGDTAGDKDRVVGYSAFVFTEI